MYVFCLKHLNLKKKNLVYSFKDVVRENRNSNPLLNIFPSVSTYGAICRLKDNIKMDLKEI